MASNVKAIWLLALAGLLVAGASAAPPPEDPPDGFHRAAAERYGEILGRLRLAGRLDDDPAFLARIQRIANGLTDAAALLRPESARWRWEVHATSDPAVAAFCIAGGKVLVGEAFVHRLDLDDGAVAMLLAHEMGHALADHRRERGAAGGMEDDPARESRLAAIALAQESEADRIGIGLARAAGWPAEGLLAFYDKLAADEPAGTFSATHPSAAARAAQARQWSREPAPMPR